MKKISAGIIRTASSRAHAIRIKEEPACLLLTVKASHTLQEMRLYVDSDQRPAVISDLKAFAGENNICVS